jgi:ubiquinone/menaquinone biosynthesis C-methylase UbiE
MVSNLVRYQRIATLYDLLDWPFERMRYRALRPLVFRGLSGRLLDAGVGTGRNIPFYPQNARVVGDLSPAMLARAERRTRLSPVPIELKQMDVTTLAFADDTFDAAVATFLFCVLPDEQQVPALRELSRVVKPGGSIRCLEYVRPQGALRQIVSRIWEPLDGYGLRGELRPADREAYTRGRFGARQSPFRRGRSCQAYFCACHAGANLKHHSLLRLEIVRRSDDMKGFVVLPRRWVVERTFSWFG